jgi:hypothetical protein
MPDATITSTASTFGTISGVFSADQSTISGTISGIIPGTLTGSVGVPGPAGAAGAPGQGVPAGGTSGQFLQKTSGADYATDWVTVNLSVYLTKADNLGSLTNFATARDNLSLGVASTPTFAGVNVPGSGTSVANLGATFLTINQSGHGQFTIQPSQGIVFPNGTIQTTAFTGAAAYISSVSSPLSVTSGNLSIDLSAYLTTSTAASTYYPLTNPSAFITASALTPYLTTSTASATYQTLAGMSSYLTTLAAASTYQTLSGMSAYLTTASAATSYYPLSGNPSGFLTSAPVTSVAGRTGAITLSNTDISGLGGLAVINDAPSDGSQYARKNGAWDIVSAGASYISSVSSPLSVTSGNLSVDLSAYAPLASPVFTGDARAVTATFGDNDTSIATTAFVQAGLAGGTAVAKNLEVYVRNQSGATIPAGSIVYISGATGNLPLITLAQANNDANSAQTMGFTATAIANNAAGYVIVRGECQNLDTSALTEGVQLYLSPTVAGAYTTTKPSAPLHLVYVGIVIRSHPTLGTILVAVQNGYELNELHDVAIGTLANNDLLAYESSTDLWKNKTYSALGLLTSADAATTYAPLASPALTGNVTITTNSTSPALFITQTGTGNILTLHDQASDTTFVAIDQNGKLNTIPSEATNGAGFNVPHGVAPTSPVNGDIWTTTAGLLARINGSTRQYVDFDGTQTINGAKTFSNASQTLGNSTAAGTIAIGSGATISGSTRTIAIGTASAAGSTNTINIGGGSGTSTTTLNGTTNFTGPITGAINNITLGNGTAASTFNLFTGATVSGSTKAVAIATGGAAGSTTTVTIGNTTGSTTTLQGITNGVTQTAGDSSLKLATTAFVTTADNLKANLASPTFTGTVTIPAGASISGYAALTGATFTGSVTLPDPVLTGLPSAPTALEATSNNQIANTFYVTRACNLKANLAGATFTGEVVTPASTTGTAGLMITPGVAPSAPVNGEIWATATDLQVRLNGVTETVAEQSWVTAQGYLTSAPVTSVAGRTGAITLANTDISGLGTMSTATAADYSTTTVANGLYYPLSSNPAGYLTTAPVTSVAGRTGAITLAVADVSGAAPLASPSLTGTPLSTTAAVDTNTTQIATTAFVVGQAAAAAPLADGTAAVGTSTRYARADHVHPTDTTRAPLASPALTGTPTAPTATGGTNTTQIATTAFVAAAIPTNSVKAWVNFNGTGTVAIRASMNVTSITDNGTGLYTLNFTTAMADTNYAMIGTSKTIVGASVYVGISESGTRSTSTVQVINNYGGTGNVLDSDFVSVAILR